MGEIIRVKKDAYEIPDVRRQVISRRYHSITTIINKEFWGIDNDKLHSLYVGSYGRGTAVLESDVDILIELPLTEYDRFSSASGNGQSRLLQAVKSKIMMLYPRTEVKANGQVVVLNFVDGLKFELLPAFRTENYGTPIYTYGDTNNGGKWRSTNPKAEQDAISELNKECRTNGLLKDTCRHIRCIHNTFFSSYSLSGIVIDTFVYNKIGNWHWLRDGEQSCTQYETFEEYLLRSFNDRVNYGRFNIHLSAPGSHMDVNTADSIECLSKVLNKIAGK